MDILKHPALCSVHSHALQSGVYGVAGGDVSHPSMPKPRMAGLQLSNELVNFFLERRWVVASKNLLSTALSKCIPIHSVHARVEMLLLHQVADFVEYFC